VNPKITAGAIIAQLRKGWDEKAFAFLEQVRGGTGTHGSRYCDALVMSLWPSRGFDVIGMEVKVSRQDWLNELKQPEKADEIFRFCNYWWLIVADRSIVREGELPRPWGLQTMGPDGVETIIDAPKLQPEPLSPAFVASVLRCVSKNEPGKERLNDSYQAGYREGYAAGEKSTKHIGAYNNQEHERLKNSIAEFERRSGVKIEFYNGGVVGEQFKRFQDADRQLNHMQRNLEAVRGAARRILDISKEVEF
jgi:hypothetical protein